MLSKQAHSNRDKYLGNKQSESKLNVMGERYKKKRKEKEKKSQIN